MLPNAICELVPEPIKVFFVRYLPTYILECNSLVHQIIIYHFLRHFWRPPDDLDILQSSWIE